MSLVFVLLEFQHAGVRTYLFILFATEADCASFEGNRSEQAAWAPSVEIALTNNKTHSGFGEKIIPQAYLTYFPESVTVHHMVLFLSLTSCCDGTGTWAMKCSFSVSVSDCGRSSTSTW